MASASGSGRGCDSVASPPAAPNSRSSPTQAKSSIANPVMRNTLRYTISAREYATLHKYVISRSKAFKKRAPSVDTVSKLIDGPPRPSAKGKEVAMGGGGGGDDGSDDDDRDRDGQGGAKTAEAVVYGGHDYNARAIRHSIRVFVATAASMKLWDAVSNRFMSGGKEMSSSAAGGRGGGGGGGKKQPLHKSPVLRLSLSLSTILLLYRLLFRFLTRLRLHILDQAAEPFRRRNPGAARTLTSPYAPAIGASLAGLALGVFPAQQMRVSIALFALFRALEFGWNCAEDGGMVWGWNVRQRAGGRGGTVAVKKERPWWFGSWLLQPLAFGQLLHAVVFDRDCFPTAYGDFIFKNSTAYLHRRPKGYPASLTWPKTYEVVDNLAQMARLNWPPFISPTLFPNKDDTLPASLAAIAPLTSPAHPIITSLSCATLHPTDPSCMRTYLTFWLRSFPPLARFFLLVHSALLVPRLGSLYNRPVWTLQQLVGRALRMSAFLTGSISTAWGSVCLFQAWFPRAFLPTQRFFLGGLLAGLWAWTERRGGRSVFLYSARVSVDSLWKVGAKRRWWRAMRGGDVWLFVAALALTGAVYERDARAVREGGWRRGISWVRGEGWRDWGAEEDEDEEGAEGEGEGEGGVFEAPVVVDGKES